MPAAPARAISTTQTAVLELSPVFTGFALIEVDFEGVSGVDGVLTFGVPGTGVKDGVDVGVGVGFLNVTVWFLSLRSA